ncbi:MAG: aminotransferase class V-fold PLP-dependent enzyme [Bacteroidales bacterium]|nr:aminotransferase class V-fold PLP-dependent enzyme [Bacteroidales bacterium]
MDNRAFRKYAHEIVDWMADYLEQVEHLPVKAQTEPGDIFNQIPDHPPEEGEEMAEIFIDFMKIIIPGMTHWQSPNFFAYFPANSSYPSVLAEMLTATLGAQCMKWETSPAAAELEEKMMNWLKEMTGLPGYFHGVIQDSASTATLVAILTAREKMSDYQVNERGLKWFDNFRVYCSSETHSSIEKAIKIAGLGRQNLVRVGVDSQQRMDPQLLKQSIASDLKVSNKPVCVVATLGTTGTTAIDPLKEIAAICSRHGIWLHVDAAFAGSALILPEYRWMIKGIGQADSFVFNPHKWLFTNFDCSAYFVKDKYALLRTLQVVPEYLRTADQGRVNDYCDWSVPLGRRFRALKLWFVLRSFGVKALQEKLRLHLSLAQELSEMISRDEEFELMAPVTLNLVCFRYKPKGIVDEDELNKINEDLLKRINKSSKAYMTHTKIDGKFAIRMVVAQTNVAKRHVVNAWKLVQSSKGKVQS